MTPDQFKPIVFPHKEAQTSGADDEIGGQSWNGKSSSKRHTGLNDLDCVSDLIQPLHGEKGGSSSHRAKNTGFTGGVPNQNRVVGDPIGGVIISPDDFETTRLDE